VAQFAQPCQRVLALVRVEVVEDGAGHEEIGRLRSGSRLDLGHPERGVEREIDVVAEEHGAGLGRPLEEREPVAARLRRLEQLAVVLEVEGAAHSTSTASSRAAASARCSASTDVSAVAIT